jgi:hypothetical protein
MQRKYHASAARDYTSGFRNFKSGSMLDIFVDSGATNFDVTFIDIDGKKCGFRAGQTARHLRTSLPQLAPGLSERHQSDSADRGPRSRGQ